jgi:hypothetical protein
MAPVFLRRSRRATTVRVSPICSRNRCALSSSRAVPSEGANDLEKLGHLCSLTYKQQAVWFLNAFWDTYQAEAPKLWSLFTAIVDADALW